MTLDQSNQQPEHAAVAGRCICLPYRHCDTRQDFTKSLISALNAASDSLTAADTNEEGANLLALQTRQSLSTTALTLASQAGQSVLQLFR